MSRYPRAIAGRGGFHLTKGMVIPPFNTRAFPQPIFDLPLKTSIILRNSIAVPSFARATIATFDDWENIVRTALSGEVRFNGARRVQNLLTNTVFAGGNVPTGWNELASNGTVKATPSNIDNLHNRLDFFVSNQREIVGFTVNLTVGHTYRISVFCEAFIPGTVTLTDNSLHTVAGTATFTGVANVQTVKFIAGKRMCGDLITCTASGTVTFRIGLGCAANEPGNGIISLSHPQIEDVTGQSNQAPGEYVSVGALAAPYHGANVDGVKYFDYQNLNSVINGNIVSTSTAAPVALPNCQYWNESARTNICTQSADFSQAIWTKGAVTIGGSVTAPDGSTSVVSKIQEDNTNALHELIQNVGIVPLTQYAVSFWAKGAEETTLVVFNANSGSVTLDTSTGIVTPAIGTATSTAYPNGWWRVTWAFTSGAAAVANIELAVRNTGAFVGVTGNGLFAWGVQVEQATFSSKYIPTVAAAVARNADFLSYPTAGSMNATQGSCYAEAQTEWNANEFSVWLVGTDTTGRILFLGGPATPPTGIASKDSGAGNSSGVGPSMFGVNRKCGSTWNGIVGNIYYEGATVGIGVLAGAMNVAQNIGIGTQGGVASNNWSGGIRNVKIWDRALSDAQMKSIVGSV